MDVESARLAFLGKAAASSDPAALLLEGVRWLRPVPAHAACLRGEEVVAVIDGLSGWSAACNADAGPVVLRLSAAPLTAVDRAFASALAQCLAAADVRRTLDLERRRRVHDLRGALAVIAGQCEMLENGVWGDLTESQLRSVQMVARQAERIRGQF